MSRVHVVCEGPTELTFVREVLQPGLPQHRLIPFLPGKIRGRPRGGDIRLARVEPDIVRVLKQDRSCFCTTLLDFYALGDDFSTCEEPRGRQPREKAERIQRAVAERIASEMGPRFDRARFHPYLSMHEFEALLFSDPRRLAEGLYRPDLEAALVEIREGFATPEHIDDGRETAPSKRLKGVCAGYDKITGGNLAALAVGLDAMRRECAHFSNWFDWLAALPV